MDSTNTGAEKNPALEEIEVKNKAAIQALGETLNSITQAMISGQIPFDSDHLIAFSLAIKAVERIPEQITKQLKEPDREILNKELDEALFKVLGIRPRSKR